MTACPIRSPRWSKPAFAAPGDRLSVAVDALRTATAFYLAAGGRRVKLDVREVEPVPKAGVVLYHVELPVDAEEGLADLVLDENGVSFTMPRAVAIHASPPARVRVVYTSDWHLLKVSKAGPPVDQSELFVQLAHHLNELAPDVVIHTGDVITRYHAGGAPLPEAEIRRQMAQGKAIFDLFRVPVFVLPGNHDVAYEWCRRAWWETVGRPWKGPTDDASRVLGPCHLLLVDGFAHYDPETYNVTARSMTVEKLAWFEGALNRGSAPWRILALHYDYTDQILPRLQELGIDLFFYGHSRSKDLEFFDCSGARNGHLPGGMVYRLAEATAENLELGPPVGFPELGIGPAG